MMFLCSVSVEVLGQLSVQLTQRRATTKHDITRLVDTAGVIQVEISLIKLDILCTVNV